jgi:diguanylate cyclase (GGDEF)-like protein
VPVADGSVKRMISVARDRLDWRDPEHHLGLPGQRGAIARTLAYLFAFGGLLLLATLALPGSPERDSAALAAVAVAAFAAAAGLIIGYDGLPWWVLAVAPAMGTALVVLVIAFAGPEASAPYAMYLAWVVIAAAGYLSHWGTAAHGAIAVAGYWLALELAGPSIAPEGLQLAMTAGTAAVAAFVMAGLAAQMRAAVTRLEDAARTDPLTGIDNRRALGDEFARELARAERTRRPMALVILDLDHFKRYNDALGHPAGDEALKRVATILDEITRSIEVTARIGGEEFAIVAPETDEAGAIALAERLRLRVQSEFASSDPPLTVSCGVAIHRPGIRRHDDLVEAADRALYAAKRAGRNRVQLAEELPALGLTGERVSPRPRSPAA